MTNKSLAIFLIVLILLSGCVRRFRSGETTTIATEETTTAPTTVTPPKFNVGYRVIDFQYTDKEDKTHNIKTALWYPTTHEMSEYVYPYISAQKQVKSRIALNATLEGERYPLILFSHGYGTCGTQSLFLTEYLASQGYIVAAPDYPEDVVGCRIDGKGDIENFLRVYMAAAKLKFMDQEDVLPYSDYRFDIASLTLDRMLELNNDTNSILYHSIDMNSIGASGHSMGALTTLGIIGAHPNSTKLDNRVKAALILSGPAYPYHTSYFENIGIPIMVMQGDNDESKIAPEIDRKLVYDYANPPKFYLMIKDGIHGTFSNQVCKGYSVQECQQDSSQAKVINSYALAFFDRYLKNEIEAEEKLKESDSMLVVYEREFTETSDEKLIPAEDKIFEHIATISNQGIRRPGYPADVWTEDYIEKQFRKYGLQDVHKEEVTHHGKDYSDEPEINLKWVPEKTSLTVYNEKESIDIPAFSVPFATSTDEAGLDLEIVTLESQKSNPAAKGKIALYPVEFRDGVRHFLYKRISEWYYDPHNTFLGKMQASTFSVEGQETMKYVIDSGAVGYIGVITNNADPTMYEYYIPADGSPRPIPGVYINEESDNKIRELMKQGPSRAKLVSKISLEPFVSHNILGTLKGKSDGWIIIGSHHDAPFQGAVEDASGIALVIAQAEYWANVPEDERPHNMLFLLDSGHLCGVTGGWSFVRKHQDLLEKVVLEIHLEHVALEYERRDDKFVPTGENQPYWWFVSQSDTLMELVKSAIETESIDRSYIFRPDAINKKTGLPTSDGAFFHRYTVPLVNLVSGPAYLLTSADTLEKVDKKSLVPITRAVIDIINGLDGVTAEQIRDEID